MKVLRLGRGEGAGGTCCRGLRAPYSDRAAKDPSDSVSDGRPSPTPPRDSLAGIAVNGRTGSNTSPCSSSATPQPWSSTDSSHTPSAPLPARTTIGVAGSLYLQALSHMLSSSWPSSGRLERGPTAVHPAGHSTRRSAARGVAPTRSGRVPATTPPKVEGGPGCGCLPSASARARNNSTSTICFR